MVSSGSECPVSGGVPWPEDVQGRGADARVQQGLGELVQQGWRRVKISEPLHCGRGSNCGSGGARGSQGDGRPRWQQRALRIWVGCSSVQRGRVVWIEMGLMD